MSAVKKAPVSAIVVAAGLSTRMGQAKQLLPYGGHTVIEQVVMVLLECPVHEIVVITGHQRQAVEERLAAWPVRPVFNPNYQTEEMLSSIQCGLLALKPGPCAALIVLGDQPQLEANVVRQLIEANPGGPNGLVIPSFQMRRGHPILLGRSYWPEILALDTGKTLRHLIKAHADEIHYVVVKTDSILRDIDTPEQYRQTLQQLDRAKTAQLKIYPSTEGSLRENYEQNMGNLPSRKTY